MEGTIDAVLPLTLKDYERSLILRRSLSEYFRGLGTIFVVSPDDQTDTIRKRVKQQAADGLRLEVLPETEVVPELRYFKSTKGWYRQQLVKLAIFKHVQSDFYLTLDADVVATRPVTSEQLVPGGRALCITHHEDVHPAWYRSAAYVLGESLRRSVIAHNVTPAVLARRGVEELAEWLGERWRRGQYASGRRGVFQRIARLRLGRKEDLAPWRLYLIAALPWTEYALYYSFLELRDRLAHYHVERDVGICDEQNSFWRADELPFNEWRHEHLFQGDGPPFFVVIQSNTGVTAEQVREKLGDQLSFDATH